MNAWRQLLSLIADELGRDAAARIEVLARREMPGQRLTIAKRPAITKDMIEETAPGHPREAAKKLGIHPTTAYRALRRTVFVR